MWTRHCSKPGCSRGAVATLTYDYSDSTVVLGSLSTAADPNAYDLCDFHAEHLTVPRGWQIVRLQTTFEPAPPSGDDLMALVEAVRRAAHTPHPEEDEQILEPPASLNLHRGASPQERAPRPRDLSAEYGPFRTSPTEDADGHVPSPGASPQEGAAQMANPLNPESPWAQRRAQFRLISDDTAE